MRDDGLGWLVIVFAVGCLLLLLGLLHALEQRDELKAQVEQEQIVCPFCKGSGTIKIHVKKGDGQ